MTKIDIKGVTKKIKSQIVIDNIDLNLSSGNIYGLKGINGSGKTMLMRLILGLIRPTSGQILIDEKELGVQISFPDNIGFLIENPSFLNSYSGFDNLKMLASVKNIVDSKHISNTLEAVGLNPDDKKKYKKYSLGMKQRLGIAASILENPKIIIMDEPTNSLDFSGVEMVKTILSQQKARGALLIISCHDISILKEMCDEIFFIEEGRIVRHICNVKEEYWAV